MWSALLIRGAYYFSFLAKGIVEYLLISQCWLEAMRVRSAIRAHRQVGGWVAEAMEVSSLRLVGCLVQSGLRWLADKSASSFLRLRSCISLCHVSILPRIAVPFLLLLMQLLVLSQSLGRALLMNRVITSRTTPSHRACFNSLRSPRSTLLSFASSSLSPSSYSSTFLQLLLRFVRHPQNVSVQQKTLKMIRLL